GEMGGAQNPKEKRKAELAALMDEFDLKTGKKSIPTPCHKEPRLNKAQRIALDAQEPREKGSGGFYKESPEMKAKQKKFDEAVHHRPAQEWQAGPVTPEERLRSWHKALGTPAHIVEQEVAELKQRQEAKK
ncbi:MAG: hypothetical protein QUS09_05090, partial [Methanotrichaceae archaeon]|nr:hypothetical protein [Methanotrichaceae archaeon]